MRKGKIDIMLVEDNPADARLTEEAMRDCSTPTNLYHVWDGEQAMGFLRREGEFADAPRPDIVLLDLNMPKMDGRAVLAQLKGDPDKVGVIAKADQRYQPVMGTEPSDGKEVELIKYGEIQEYKDMLAAYKEAEKKAKTDFQRSHLEATWTKIQAKRNELVGPIKALEKSLKDDALKLLTREQLAHGPAPRESTPLTRASDQAML